MVEEFRTLIDAEIRKQQFGFQPKSLYEPIRYIMALGGKRLRPLLTLFSYSLYRTDVETIVPYAAAIEAFHNFTLLHDDIMDKAPLRRGKKTVHEKWNVNTAILSGDVMLVKVYEMFLGLEEKKLKAVLPIFNQCAAEVCEGQQWDMEFEAKPKVSEAQYIEMIRLKTAVLLGFSLELGAALADAPVVDQKLLRDFGVNIGIGFQLKDDLLDVYADKKKFGKQVGGDIIANKKTFLLIKALEKAKGDRKKELGKWLVSKKFDKRKKINAVTAIYDDLGIPKITEAKMNQFFDKGFASVSELSVNKKANSLIEFARNLIDRES
ncbi:MAG TPA: polyprenyl synthetase family protein [Cyclobacteriaceae bacterium]|jgi:geranylgeranyl diphosphate synthase type II|nr:polyprenyl synthetase family protein [Cyclobacteriaceae bacterium]